MFVLTFGLGPLDGSELHSAVELDRLLVVQPNGRAHRYELDWTAAQDGGHVRLHFTKAEDDAVFDEGLFDANSR